jgi:HEAT repeat protein
MPVVAVKEALVRLGPGAVPPLLGAVRNERDWVRSLVAEALGRIGDRRAVPALTEMLNDKQSWVAARAALALDQLGSERGADWILQTLKARRNGLEIQSAGKALSGSRNPKLRAHCERVLESGEPGGGFYAAEALARMGVQKGLDWLRARLADSEGFSVHRAIEALERLGDCSCALGLVKRAEDRGQDVVQAVIPALGRNGTRPAADTLIRLALGPEMVRGYARLKRDSITALGSIRTRRVVEVLLKLLGDRDPTVAGTAASSLANIAGADLGTDPARWRTWLAHHRDQLPADSPPAVAPR